MILTYVCSNMSVLAGGQIVMADKINWLAEHGHKIILFMCDQGEKLVIDFHPSVILERPEIYFYRTYSQPQWKRPFDYYKRHRLFRKKLKECLEKYHPDVVVTPTLSQIKEICNVCGAIPVVAEMHNNEGAHFRKSGNETWLGDIMREWYRHHAKKLAKMVVLTEGDRKDWLRYLPENKIEVVPNITRLNSTGRIADMQHKRVVFVGRITYQKGIDYLIQVWRMIRERFPDWTLSIYGRAVDGTDGQYQDALNACKENLHIVQHGPVSEIMTRFIDSSMLVLASRHEAFGLVLPEAMSCGLPVVAFDCPYGPRDIITDGEDGFLVPLGDCKAFAEKIIYLIEHPEERKRMGQSGIVASKRFAAETIMPRWVELFHSLL